MSELQEYWARVQRKTYANRRAKGLCGRSGKHGPAVSGKSICAGCIARIAMNPTRSRDAYRKDHPDARRYRCGVCDSTEHNARRCPARREQETS